MSGTNLNALPVCMPGDLWRCGFTSEIADGITPEYFRLIRKDPGATIAQTGGNLVIGAGTTLNEEVIAVSNRSFTGPHNCRIRLTLSQRIANNNFIIELADVVGENLLFTNTSATNVDVAFGSNPCPFKAENIGQTVTIININGVAGVPGDAVIAAVTDAGVVSLTVSGWPGTGTGTLSIIGHNCYRLTADGTTATNLKWEPRRRGRQVAAVAFGSTTTASPGILGYWTTDVNSAHWGDTSGTVTTSSLYAIRATRAENLVDEDIPLYLFIRSVNGTTAPASNTTATIGMIGVEMFSANRGASTPVAIGPTATPGVQPVIGQSSNGSTTVGNVLQVSALQTQTGVLTAADSNNSARLGFLSPARALYVRPGAIRAGQSQGYITLTTTTETTLLAAVASLFQDVTTVVISNRAAAVNSVDFRGTTGGPVLFSVTVPANATVTVDLGTGVLQAAVNTNWTAQATAVGDVRIYARADRSVG